MKPIQILMDAGTLGEIDREAKRRHSDRSKLIRAAVASFLVSSRRRALEEQHRHGYQKRGQDEAQVEEWTDIQAWPER